MTCFFCTSRGFDKCYDESCCKRRHTAFRGDPPSFDYSLWGSYGTTGTAEPVEVCERKFDDLMWSARHPTDILRAGTIEQVEIRTAKRVTGFATLSIDDKEWLQLPIPYEPNKKPPSRRYELPTYIPLAPGQSWKWEINVVGLPDGWWADFEALIGMTTYWKNGKEQN